MLTPELLAGIVAAVPDEWLGAIPGEMAATERRQAYMQFFNQRLEQAHTFVQEAIDARTRLI